MFWPHFVLRISPFQVANITNGSKLPPHFIMSNRDDTTVNNPMVSSSERKKSGKNSKSTKKHHFASNSEILSRTSCREKNQRLRKVSFAEKVMIKIVDRIPKIYAMDTWYTAHDMDNFRAMVLNCKELQLRVKLKSARSYNHMRRVLLEYRANRAQKGNKAISSRVATRNPRDLSIVSSKSSKKPREEAIKNAIKLEKEIIADQSFLNPTISSACAGSSHRWVLDYYLGYLIDTLCTVI